MSSPPPRRVRLDSRCFHPSKTCRRRSPTWRSAITALEHVENPIDSLRLLRRALKAGGRLRLVIPAESPFWRSQRGSGADPYQAPVCVDAAQRRAPGEAAGFSDAVGTVAPIPTGSRPVAMLRSWPALQARAHWARAWWFERFNVIVDATNRDK